MSEWPEAYEEFVELSYTKVEDDVSPEMMSFLVLTIKLAEIDSVEIQNRFDRVTLKIRETISYQHYEIGESQTYAWAARDNKEVTRVSFYFMFSC